MVDPLALGSSRPGQSGASQRLRSWDCVFMLDRLEGSGGAADGAAKGWFRYEEVVLAASHSEAIRTLRIRGAVVIEVHERPMPHPLFNRTPAEYKQQMLLSLMFAVDGGTSPGRALESLIEQERGPVRAKLNVGLTVLKQGRPFLDAFRAIEMFDETTLAIIEAGEEMGKLPQALRTAAEHMDKSAGTGKLIMGAVFVTAIDLVLAVGSIFGTRFGMIPQIRDQGISSQDPQAIADFKQALDIATLANDVMLWLTILICVMVSACVAGYFGRDESVRRRIDEFLLRMPLIKDLLLHSALSNTAAVMSSLLKGGVTFLSAVEITARGVRMSLVSSFWTSVHEDVSTGAPVGRSLAREPLALNEQMVIMAHKDVAQLATAMDMVSVQREDKAKKAAKKFGAAMFFGSLIYSAISLLITLFVVYVQNQGAMSTPGG